MQQQQKSIEHFPTINDAALEDLRRRIGVKIVHTLEPWVSEANRDAIRHYAHGIGDDNPLWCDPEYAQNTRYGTIIAPPSFLYAANRIVSGYVGGLPGVHAMFAGTDWTWLLPIRRNDEIKSAAYLKDLIVRQTRFAGRAVQQIYHVDFYNQRDKKIAEADSWCFRTERQTARDKGTKYKDLKPKKIYTAEEIQAISEAYLNEEVRGATPRYWEDVKVGDTLPSIVKGPMTVTGFIGYVQGWGGLYIRAHKIAFKTFAAHPNLGIPNAQNIPDAPERVHWEEALARAVGTPDPYDYGPERISWMGHLMTNWIGDDGWLSRLNAKIVRHNPVGDLLTINGKVVGKFERDGEGFVVCDLLATNQDGERSCEGQAEARLPRKGG